MKIGGLILLIALTVIAPLAVAQEKGVQQAPNMTVGSDNLQILQRTGKQLTGARVSAGMGADVTPADPSAATMPSVSPGATLMSCGAGAGTIPCTSNPNMSQGVTAPGLGAIFGSRVLPMMNLTTEDVRTYLSVRLDGIHNKRLKVGDVKADDGVITADIVTLEDSLVQQIKVDRHTGLIEYVN